MAACPCLKITDHSCTSLQCICISSTFFFSTYSIYSMLLLHCFNDNLSFYINQSMTQIETLWFPCHIKKIQFVGYTSTNLWLNTQTFLSNLIFQIFYQLRSGCAKIKFKTSFIIKELWIHPVEFNSKTLYWTLTEWIFHIKPSQAFFII